jgi:hypothetical protein
MEPAEKALRYARLFRKAGALLAKGRISRAVTALEDGRALADRLGDHAMARRFTRAIEQANSNTPTDQ